MVSIHPTWTLYTWPPDFLLCCNNFAMNETMGCYEPLAMSINMVGLRMTGKLGKPHDEDHEV